MRLPVALALVLAAFAVPEAGSRIVASFAENTFAPPAEPRTQPLSPGKPGALVPVRGRSRPSGSGPPMRYVVEVEGRLPVDAAAFARRVQRVLASPRSWGGSGRVAFQRVSGGRVDFRVALARPETTDLLCAPLATRGIYSCARAGRAVLNARRWLQGATAFGTDLRSYRAYMVNHEVGHLLGHPHRGCFEAGVRAPVMMQQTKGVGGCRANPWPLDWERG